MATKQTFLLSRVLSKKFALFWAILPIPIQPNTSSNRTKCIGFLFSPLKATADVIWLFNQPIDNHFACLPFWCLLDCLTLNYVIGCLHQTSSSLPVWHQQISNHFVPLSLSSAYILLNLLPPLVFLIYSSWIKITCNGECVVLIHFVDKVLYFGILSVLLDSI